MVPSLCPNSLERALSGPPMSEDAARFRKQAEECREQAAKTVKPLDK
jgi:hypothetical protein